MSFARVNEARERSAPPPYKRLLTSVVLVHSSPVHALRAYAGWVLLFWTLIRNAVVRSIFALICFPLKKTRRVAFPVDFR